MSITYSYNIIEMQKSPSLDGLNDVVTKVKFIYYGESDTGIKVEGPKITVNIPLSNPETFKSFETLTKTDIIEWLEVCYPIDYIKDKITEHIDDHINPKDVVTTMPWDLN